MKKQSTDQNFLEAYDRLADPIFRHCYFRVSDRERAKDITQDAFIRTWEYIASGNNVKNIKTFLYRVANNLIIDHYRRRKDVSLDILVENGLDFANEDYERMSSQIDGQKIVAALDGLDDAHRGVLVMRYVDGLAPKEIAAILDESENAVSVRIYRAIRQVRKLFEK